MLIPAATLVCVQMITDNFHILSQHESECISMEATGTKFGFEKETCLLFFFLSLLNDMSLKKTLGHEFFGGYVGYVCAKCQPLLSIFVVSMKSRLRSTNGIVLSIPTQNIRLPFPYFEF